MKMTMHINEDILASVMEVTGASTKTAAVEKALTEMARRHKLGSILREGMGMSNEEIKNCYDFAAYDAEDTGRRIEFKVPTKVTYARKSSR